jgi:hypothetical protein
MVTGANRLMSAPLDGANPYRVAQGHYIFTDRMVDYDAGKRYVSNNFEVVRDMYLRPGESFYYRYYLILNTKTRMVEEARKILAGNHVGYGYLRTGYGEVASACRPAPSNVAPQMSAMGYSKLCPYWYVGGRPIFLITAENRTVVTTDPYDGRLYNPGYGNGNLWDFGFNIPTPWRIDPKLTMRFLGFAAN